ncbi:MAG: AtpZ/AtpI family protein [Bradymonadaceae bacterium]
MADPLCFRLASGPVGTVSPPSDDTDTGSDDARADGDDSDRRGRWTRALAFSGLGLEFLAAVGGGMYVGYRLDQWLETEPALTLLCAGLFLIGAALHVYRMFLRLTDMD